MNRKTILSLLIGAMALISVGCTNVSEEKVGTGNENKKIVENTDSSDKEKNNNENDDKDSKKSDIIDDKTSNDEKNKDKDSSKEEEKSNIKQSENKKSDGEKDKENKEEIKKIENNDIKKEEVVKDNTIIKKEVPKKEVLKKEEPKKEVETVQQEKPKAEVTKPTVESNDSGSFMESVESEIIKIVNVERGKAGKKPLSYNGTMRVYARNKSKDMAINNYFSHTDKSNRTEYDKMKAEGVSVRAWGENIAYMSNRSASILASEFMKNWMNSPGHKANILSDKFTGIGVGVYKYGDKIYATQEFCA